VEFKNAGVETSLLPSDFVYDATNDVITLTFTSDNKEIHGNADIIELFKSIVKYARVSIGYHEDLDHYGIAIGKGNMIEWARDININDKDYVLVLNPEPFIAAGLDVAKLSGFVYAAVKVKDTNGKKVEVMKLLKPYNVD